MAYAALVYLDQQLQQLLLKHHEYSHLYAKEQIESFYSNVIFLEYFLEDFQGNSRLIKQLESQITDVAYKVSDIIGWGISNEEHKSTFEACIREFCSAVEDATRMKTNILCHDYPVTSSLSTVPVPGAKNTVVGLETNLIQMKERIMGRNSTLEIIPVTGMGGLGKTTLAKIVYEDPANVAHFDVRSWVTVSQEHNAQKILKEILGDANYGEENIGSLIVRVHKELSGRRFLIVIDDIWSTEAWDSVRNAFPDDNKSSRIVITTRLTEVATKVGSSCPLHEMHLMNEVQSWELFQKEAFGKLYCPSQLENIGKTISKNCKGLPLAIVVIARLLKLNRTEDYWQNFVGSMHEARAEVTHDDQIMKILSLSYDNLPPHLKACFLHTSMFPEDAYIPTTMLKGLWVAEGFLKSTADKSVEEVAENFLLDLIDRNLLFVGEKRSTGRIRNCTVHDLLRDLSLSKAQEDKFSVQITSLNTVYRRGSDTNNPAICKTKDGYIYSLICHGEIDSEDVIRTMRSKLVRVVEAQRKLLDPSISFGVNLRYLAFSYSGGSNELNDTLAEVRKLQNLETLIINHSCFSQNLSFPILEMPKLKHLFVQDPWGTHILIDGRNNNSVSNKSLLKTLSGVRDFELTTDEIHVVENLVKLKIKYEKEIMDRVCLCLRQLENLNLTVDCISTYLPLPTNIAFPDKLKKITLQQCIISWETMSAMGSLPNLQVLKLVCRFESNVWEPVEGEFQQLKFLRLDIINLKEWIVESDHFPCLEQLILRGCLDLNEVPAEVGEINTLQYVVIIESTRRVGDSARRIQEEQQSFENYQLQVDVVNQLPWE